MKAIIEDDGEVYGISKSEALKHVGGKEVKELSDKEEHQLKDVLESNFDNSSFDKTGRGFYEYYAKKLRIEGGEFVVSESGA